MYDDFVVLVDFNSLYPSIIRNFNICFTTIQRNFLEYDGGIQKKRVKSELVDKPQKEPEEENINVDDLKNEGVDYMARIRNTHIEKINGEYKEVDNYETPILVRIVTLLIEKRKQVKSILKSSGLSQSQRRKFDIIQKAYKLTANSIYGCLGFPRSRFYSRLIADTVTGLGRQLLVQSKEMVEESGYKVIYGDTDSIMINTESATIVEAVTEAHKIKSIINKMFRMKNTNESQGGNHQASDKYNQKYNKEPVSDVNPKSDQIISEKADAKVTTVKKIIGRNEGILQVGIDGVYKKLLLIKKKKYAGLMVTNWNEMFMKKETVEKTKLEVKGLEIVRRDCPQIAKDITKTAIEIVLYQENYLELLESHLLSYRNALEMFEQAYNVELPKEGQNKIQAESDKGKRKNRIVYNLVSSQRDPLSQQSLNGTLPKSSSQTNGQISTINSSSGLPYTKIQISLNSFVIKKMLNKSLRQYSDIQNHPHAIVAQDLIQRENKKEEELIGRFIPYLITQSKEKNQSIGKRAMHLNKIRKEGANIDLEWYKVNQIRAILGRSIGVVHNIDEDFLNKMLGLKGKVISEEEGNYGQQNPLILRLLSLPSYYRSMFKSYGLKTQQVTDIFSTVCSHEKCSGCSLFLSKCVKSEESFSQEEVSLRAEMVLNKLNQKYQHCLKFGVSDSPFEINPLLENRISDQMRIKYKTLDSFFYKIHVCFYIYFLLFKIAIIELGKNLKGNGTNEIKLDALDVLEFEQELSLGPMEYLLKAVNESLNGFKTNYLDQVVDLEFIEY